MKKQLLIIAIIVLVVVLITVYMFFMYGISEAKQMAPMLNPPA
jgi:flagellar basal body-associated protein FliL